METITVEQAAKKKGCSTARIRKLLAEGRIPGEKSGRDWVIDVEGFERWRKSTQKAVPATIRQAVLVRDNFTCTKCGHRKLIQPESATLHVYHVVERDAGGSNDLENLVTLCPSCHSKHHHQDCSRSLSLTIARELPDVTLVAIDYLADYLKVTAAEVVVRAVGEMDERVRIAQIAAASALAAMEGAADPTQVPGVQVGVGAVQGFEVICVHCGVEFIGPKRVTVCPGCRKDGHSGDPRECDACNTGRAI